MHETSTNVAPVVRVFLAHDDHVDRGRETSQRTPQPDRLGRGIVDVRFDDEQVEIAAIAGLASRANTIT